MNTNSKAGAANTGFKPKTFNIAGGKENAFDVSDYAEKQENLQQNLTENLVRHKKIVRLHLCFGCGKGVSAAKFSVYYAICKNCLRQAKEKSKLGKSNFIERTLNNLRKNLKGALTDV